MNYQTISVVSLLGLAVSFIATPIKANPVYIYVHDSSSVTQVTDNVGNVISMPIRVVDTSQSFNQPGYNSEIPWCQLQGSSVYTLCTPEEIYNQIRNSSSYQDCWRYTGELKPIHCQTPEDRARPRPEFRQPRINY